MLVVGEGHKYCPCGLSSPNAFAWLFWLANNKKANIQSSVWATVTKFGMWVVVDISTTHVVCCHQMHIFNTSFAYLFSLVNNKNDKYPEFFMGYSDKTWYGGGGSVGHKYYPPGLSSQNVHI